MTTVAPPLCDLLLQMGQKLDFDVKSEVQASTSAWVDVVWFDKRLGLDHFPKPNLRRDPVLPVVGFEIELKTGQNAKHIKGSVSNLKNLGASMGVIVIGSANFQSLAELRKSTANEAEAALLERVYFQVYSEAQPRTRIVVMTEQMVRSWGAKVLGG